MRAALLLVLLPLLAPGADKILVTRTSIAGVERHFDENLRRTFGLDSPVEMIVLPLGVYLDRFGIVFTSELNVLQTAGQSPFRPQVTAAEISRVREMKLKRIPGLKEQMRKLLVRAAAELDAVPLNEQVVLGLTLFYWHWEDTKGLPAQIVMTATRGALLEMKSGRSADTAIRVQEF